MRVFKIAAAVLAAFALAGGAARAQTETQTTTQTMTQTETQTDDGWQFSLTPYLWTAGLGGSVSDRAGHRASFNESFSDILSHLNAGLMLLGDVQYRRWIFLTDFDYINLSAKSNALDQIAGQAGLRAVTYLATVEGGYRIIDAPAGTLDGLVGIRIISMDNTLHFSGALLPAFTVKNDNSWVNPVAGIRGKFQLGDGFFLTGYGDIGAAGDNDLTWQLYGGAGYTISPRFAAYAGYRYLAIRHNEDHLTLDINEQGPLLGVSYQF